MRRSGPLAVPKQRGGLFASDLVLEMGLSQWECAEALWDIVWSGEVTKGSFVVVRSGRPAPKAGADYPWRRPSRGSASRGFRRQIARLRGYRAIDGAGRRSLFLKPIQPVRCIDKWGFGPQTAVVPGVVTPGAVRRSPERPVCQSFIRRQFCPAAGARYAAQRSLPA